MLSNINCQSWELKKETRCEGKSSKRGDSEKKQCGREEKGQIWVNRIKPEGKKAGEDQGQTHNLKKKGGIGRVKGKGPWSDGNRKLGGSYEGTQI